MKLHDITDAFNRENDPEIIRETRGRKVVRFSLKDNRYYLKIFYISSNPVTWLKALREYRSHTRLYRLGVALPEPLGMTWLSKKNGVRRLSFVTREVEDSVSLVGWDELWQDTMLQEKVFTKLVGFLVSNYKNGILHNDLHFGNILWKKGEENFVFVDPKQIVCGRKCSRKDTINNFVLLYSHFFNKKYLNIWNLVRDLFIERYELTVDEVFLLEQLKTEAFYKWLGRRVKRCFRDNIDFKRWRGHTFSGVYQKRIANSLGTEPDRWLKKVFLTGGDYFKDSNTTAVLKCSLSDTPVVIKKFKVKRFYDPLKNLFRRSRGYRSWKYSWMMRLQQIPTPEPLFYFENRFCGLLGECYYGMNYSADAIGVDDYLNSGEEFNKEKFLGELAKIVVCFNKTRLYHKDFQLKNMLVDPKQNDFKFYIIDLEAINETLKESDFKIWGLLEQLKKSYLRLNDKDIFSIYQVYRFLRLVLGKEIKNRQKLIDIVKV